MRNATLSNKVYHDIKNMMITLVFPPGAMLKEQVLADMLGVSRTPVREALQRLFHEGWVQLEDKKRVRVSPVTISSINELFQLRSILEPYAARETLKRGKSRTLAGKLDEVLNVMDQVQNDRVAFARLDMQFHSLIIKNMENERLNRFWKTLHEETSRVAVMNLSEDNRSAAVIEEHAKMIDAFWKKDIDVILSAISEHHAKSRDALAVKLKDIEDYAVNIADPRSVPCDLREDYGEEEHPCPGVKYKNTERKEECL